MNPSTSFPPRGPALKLARQPAEKWSTTLTEERRRLLEDQDALREREQNLREYEARLRALQAEIEARSGRGPVGGESTRPATTPPFLVSLAPAVPGDAAALSAGWEKLHRARELLEAEQNNFRDERIALRGWEEQVKQREAAVAVREARIAAYEARAAAAVAAADDPGKSTLSRMTQAPFTLARSVFGKK